MGNLEKDLRVYIRERKKELFEISAKSKDLQKLLENNARQAELLELEIRFYDIL